MSEKYQIEKAPSGVLRDGRSDRRKSFPLSELNVGEMFSADPSEKQSIYNAIKHRRNYTRELWGRKFKIVTVDENKIACIRIT